MKHRVEEILWPGEIFPYPSLHEARQKIHILRMTIFGVNLPLEYEKTIDIFTFTSFTFYRDIARTYFYIKLNTVQRGVIHACNLDSVSNPVAYGL